MANFLFYLLSLIAVVSAVCVIASRSAVVSVLALLATFFCMAVIYLLAGFQFLAAVQILVYAGAIMVLFLFVVMLLNQGDASESTMDEPVFGISSQEKRALLGVGVAGALLFAALAAILTTDLAPPVPEIAAQRRAEGIDSVRGLSEGIFGRYALPFQAAAVLLLATAVGVMVLAKRQRPELDPPTEDPAEDAERRAEAATETGGTP